MYEIRIDPGPETGGCMCEEPDCQFHEDVIGRAEILHMQHDAAMHAMVTGHRVTEHWGGARTVSPRSLADF